MSGHGQGTTGPTLSRRPPQEDAVSHDPKGEAKHARREATVGEPSQSSRSHPPNAAQPGSPRHEGAENQHQHRAYKHAYVPRYNNATMIAKRESRGLKALWQVQDSVLPAGGLPA